jgi:hypothetical protein
MADEPRRKEDSIDSVTGHDPTIIVDVPEKLGPYCLLRLLGRGGMGEVWLAHDTKLDREVAIKLMRRELMAREDAVKRFYREARAVARLNHPNIVQVYAIGEEGPIIYMVMEYVDGETVAQRLKRLGPLPLRECVNILLQAVEGLGYASARGIIHRDIKPSNMMISSDFRVKIADFGLAKMIEHDSQMTVAGTAIGSPNYMSPEQARGEEADHRSDIYALGISFFQMLTNELPFTGTTPLTVLLRQIQDPLPEPEFLRQLEDGRVLDVIKKMSAKNPDERYQTYGGLAAALASLAPDVRLHAPAHAVTSTIPTPSAQAGEESIGRGETTDEADLRTHVHPHAHGAAASEATATMPTPAAPADRLAFAGIIAVAITVLGVVGIVAVILILRYRPPTAAVEVVPRAAHDHAPAPSPPAATPMPPGGDLAHGAARPQPTIPAASAGPTQSVQAAAPPPAAQPSATPSPAPALPTQLPTTIDTIILGPPNAVAGVRIPLFESPGRIALELNAGTRLSFTGLAQLGSAGTFYKVTYGGRNYLVRYADARPEVFGPGSGSVGPSRQGLTIRLGTKDDKPSQTVPIFGGPQARRELTRLPVGTTLPAEETDDGLGYRVNLPDGKQGFVFKKLAQPEP